MHLPDWFTGLFFVVLGGLAYYGGSLLPPVPGQDVGPNVFPMLVGGSLVLCGVMITLGIGQKYEEEAEADLVAHSDPDQLEAPQTGWLGGLKALLPPAMLLFYVAVVDRLGFVPTASIVIFSVAVGLRAPLRIAIPVALAGSIAIYLVFLKLLRVPLPAGLLSMLW